jgi:DNA-directed RNA polymerase specialized sigma24 family protein
VQSGGREQRHITQPLRADPPLHYETSSDPSFVRRGPDGDREALRALCSRHATCVERVAARVLWDPGDAKDAAHELLSQVCQQIGRAEPAGISASHARVVVLKDACDYSFAEISAAAGFPVGTAKCYARRGRKSLRRRLEALETA